MYQSKLAKPEVKPHFYFDGDRWTYVRPEKYKCVSRLLKVCDLLNRTYNPLRSGK